MMIKGRFPELVLLMVLTSFMCAAGLTKRVTGLFMFTAATLVKSATVHHSSGVGVTLR